ncbi:MAG: hypothetical protein JWQ09_1580 [Segetibacter sp.]|nr:hypothetical protein [Segetibacter sp.]
MNGARARNTLQMRKEIIATGLSLTTGIIMDPDRKPYVFNWVLALQ